ncbi:hypothetical protein BKA81DRAFT_378578 [Phyllosticta paracitricarpa]|uniref:Uncharacterized protein n=1 Tax=Phyllosticta citricarpa TaxID=55181 RepID=A0ABR1MPI5_9PEZI
MSGGERERLRRRRPVRSWPWPSCSGGPPRTARRVTSQPASQRLTKKALQSALVNLVSWPTGKQNDENEKLENSQRVSKEIMAPGPATALKEHSFASADEAEEHSFAATVAPRQLSLTTTDRRQSIVSFDAQCGLERKQVGNKGSERRRFRLLHRPCCVALPCCASEPVWRSVCVAVCDAYHPYRTHGRLGLTRIEPSGRLAGP